MAGSPLDPPLPRPDPRKGLELGPGITSPYVAGSDAPPYLHWYTSDPSFWFALNQRPQQAARGHAAEENTRGAIHPQTLLELLGVITSPETFGDPNRIDTLDIFQKKFRYPGQDL